MERRSSPNKARLKGFQLLLLLLVHRHSHLVGLKVDLKRFLPNSIKLMTIVDRITAHFATTMNALCTRAGSKHRLIFCLEVSLIVIGLAKSIDCRVLNQIRIPGNCKPYLLPTLYLVSRRQTQFLNHLKQQPKIRKQSDGPA